MFFQKIQIASEMLHFLIDASKVPYRYRFMVLMFAFLA